MGRFASDWLDGKSVPQAMDILPKALTIANIGQYERDVADPSAVYADSARRNSYLRMYGNICFMVRRNLSAYSNICFQPFKQKRIPS